MKKRLVLALTCLLLGGAGINRAYAVEQVTPDSMKSFMEMRKNIAWTVEGLYQLGKSKDRALKLTPAQAKKILPLYQELIAKKIVQLKLAKGIGEGGPEPGRPGGPPPSGKGDPKEGPPAAPPGGDPQPHQARMRERATLVPFGNAKMEAINRILTKRQVEFIDNWDFKAEKYGFPNFPNHVGGNHPGGNGQFGEPPRTNHGQPGNLHHGRRRAMDPKLEAGRKLLIELNQNVLKILQSIK